MFVVLGAHTHTNTLHALFPFLLFNLVFDALVSLLLAPSIHTSPSYLPCLGSGLLYFTSKCIPTSHSALARSLTLILSLSLSFSLPTLHLSHPINPLPLPHLGLAHHLGFPFRFVSCVPSSLWYTLLLPASV